MWRVEAVHPANSGPHPYDVTPQDHQGPGVYGFRSVWVSVMDRVPVVAQTLTGMLWCPGPCGATTTSAPRSDPATVTCHNPFRGKPRICGPGLHRRLVTSNADMLGIHIRISPDQHPCGENGDDDRVAGTLRQPSPASPEHVPPGIIERPERVRSGPSTMTCLRSP